MNQCGPGGTLLLLTLCCLNFEFSRSGSKYVPVPRAIVYRIVGEIRKVSGGAFISELYAFETLVDHLLT